MSQVVASEGAGSDWRPLLHASVMQIAPGSLVEMVTCITSFTMSTVISRWTLLPVTARDWKTCSDIVSEVAARYCSRMPYSVKCQSAGVARGLETKVRAAEATELASSVGPTRRTHGRRPEITIDETRRFRADRPIRTTMLLAHREAETLTCTFATRDPK
ncbi:hypothetical protein C8J57DRAFT_1309868 [Mycena rebaudengoi]|nr:hypothetical protein C8J57DRAFT_1309868 [Mycena rebaudengoi]